MDYVRRRNYKLRNGRMQATEVDQVSTKEKKKDKTRENKTIYR